MFLIARWKRNVPPSVKRGNGSLPVPYDVILATNMISVGVDIDRLGLMELLALAKEHFRIYPGNEPVCLSADSPGLVCTVFNWARPRDLSHYERFEHYHETFYKHVEALSVTPYSARALDRGLSGVMVGLMRLLDDHLNANLKAGEVEDTDGTWAKAFDVLKNRGKNATHDQTVAKRIEDMLDRRRDLWSAEYTIRRTIDLDTSRRAVPP